MKLTIKTEIIPVILLVSSIAISFYFYSVFPDRVPIHWNIEGEVDSYGSRAMGAFLFPGIILGVYLLFLVLPFVDPRKERYEQFKKTYHFFKGALLLFMTGMYFTTSFYTLGYGSSPAQFVPLAVGLLFIVLGNYMPKIKTNWFMGIRTPWTLSSETVWQKTHRVGGKIFIFSGLIFMLIPFVSVFWKLSLFILLIIIMSVGLMAYSFYLYRKEEKIKQGKQS